jgi:hypothetical protein
MHAWICISFEEICRSVPLGVLQEIREVINKLADSIDNFHFHGNCICKLEGFQNGGKFSRSLKHERIDNQASISKRLNLALSITSILTRTTTLDKLKQIWNLIITILGTSLTLFLVF